MLDRPSDRLFTPRFFIMFGYTFTVFASVFQLLPTAPYRVLAIGGSTAVAGLFHGFLTFSSASSGPITGVLSDRIGHRPVLITVSLILSVFSVSYAFINEYRIMLAVVVVHGMIWSALLAASGAYMTATIPETRRAEGLSYWGLATILATGTAPILGFWVYRHGWAALCFEMAGLNILMAVIAWMLPDDRREASHQPGVWTDLSLRPANIRAFVRAHVEWRVFWLSITTGAITFGYGALTSFSALFADELGVSPRSLFLSVMAVAVIFGRLAIGRGLDSIGPRRVLLPCLVVPSMGLFVLATANGAWTIAAAALIFGSGFGLMQPSYTSYVLAHVAAHRRGAAFGAMLAAFDTGIGSGASLFGVMSQAFGSRVAFAAAGVLAALSMPYFVLAERRLGFLASTR
jgi:predicted MFS family arabinose efflux permease